MTVSCLQEQLAYSEFLEWCVFLEWEEREEHTALHYYLAQIAKEIRMHATMGKSTSKMEDFLIKFKPPLRRTDINTSKTFWLTVCGVTPTKGK